jgi:hypothetical protein
LHWEIIAEPVTAREAGLLLLLRGADHQATLDLPALIQFNSDQSSRPHAAEIRRKLVKPSDMT